MNRTEAKQHLLTIISDSPGTVIDADYEDVLKETSERRKTLRALVALTGLTDYDNLNQVYEGYTLEELVALEHAYWVCQCDKNYVHLRSEKTRCEECNYSSAFLPSPGKEEVKSFKLQVK